MTNKIVFISLNASQAADLESADKAANALNLVPGTQISFHYKQPRAHDLYTLDLGRVAGDTALKQKFFEVFKGTDTSADKIYTGDVVDARRRLQEITGDCTKGTCPIPPPANSYNLPIKTKDLADFKKYLPIAKDLGPYADQDTETNPQEIFHHVVLDFTDGEITEAEKKLLHGFYTYITQHPDFEQNPTIEKMATRFGAEVLTLHQDALEYEMIPLAVIPEETQGQELIPPELAKDLGEEMVNDLLADGALTLSEIDDRLRVDNQSWFGKSITTWVADLLGLGSDKRYEYETPEKEVAARKALASLKAYITN